VPIDDIDLRNSAILLDVDSTILDIAATPRDVVVPQRQGRGASVALVSGPYGGRRHLLQGTLPFVLALAVGPIRKTAASSSALRAAASRAIG
jgi:hypothetical protein